MLAQTHERRYRCSPQPSREKANTYVSQNVSTISSRLWAQALVVLALIKLTEILTNCTI